MGHLVDGVWKDEWYDTKSHGGKFIRTIAQWRSQITKDGSSEFPAESGRYHLYVSYACPWSHRTIMVWVLKGLENIITLHAVHPLMREHGWTFDSSMAGATGDRLYGLKYLYQLYTMDSPDATTRVTVPVLWDSKTKRIVNNESSDIIRMFNECFDDVGAKPGNFYPPALRLEIDQINSCVYDEVNNGVYKAGFATSQEAYNPAVQTVFAGLDKLEAVLSKQRYLTGDQFTEADIRLFVTLIRFDAVYVTHFKCDYQRLSDYPNLHSYTRDIYQMPGIQATVNFPHIRTHYFCSHKTINPSSIISIGPKDDLDRPHDREKFASS
eukprot:Gregarina_sp_Poly_1__3331@NODE_195_length_11596_cov_85_481395_g174_i0_p3_GENE_NODE_195_length_11596_cov_85_481395_g174_i0NODE_195_length_11596_cov_85_481395_g174_i0_p3_ORF_typecomplete_len324_score31_80GST_N_2/PF13409_6/3_1e24GST_C_2/PF13410_6/1_7e19GST_C/PF00043_25/1_8e12GST_C_3/PF14497_6/2_4e09GST_C_5/PF16865_5/8_6e06GST_C_6/PF17171_4/8_5e03GST_C_6/PF17171_4/0_0061GST_N_3/PF13417_6/0_13Glutaredoxin2_C/PF04399_13/0_15_NODE_195_length_11596_cov_85_481395_g174_i04871458